MAMLQTYLHLLLKISESVARLESLLLIASPDGPSSPELKTLPLKSLGGMGEDSDDRCVLRHRVTMRPNSQLTKRPRGNRAKHLVRVATEYTQLLYHVSKAQADARSAFVDEIQWVCELSLFQYLPHEPVCHHSESAAYSQHCHQTLIISSLTL